MRVRDTDKTDFFTFYRRGGARAGSNDSKIVDVEKCRMDSAGAESIAAVEMKVASKTSAASAVSPVAFDFFVSDLETMTGDGCSTKQKQAASSVGVPAGTSTISVFS